MSFLPSEHVVRNPDLDEASLKYSKRSADFGLPPDNIEKQIKLAEEQYHSVEGLCDSPIERAILPWLIYEQYGCGPQVARCYNWRDSIPPIHDSAVIIIPQFAILRFRVDFMIIAKLGNSQRSVMVALECDGFQYHNTPRDIQRDGHMAMMGIHTVRADGTEIRRYPSQVSARVAATLAGASQ